MSKLDDRLETKVEFIIPANIIERYSEPHRKYHDLYHLEYMLKTMYKLFAGEELSVLGVQALVWAIVYHDSVYNIPDPDKRNEELSAELFLEDHADHSYAEFIAEAIRSTKTHILPKDASILSKYLVDLDLWALGDEEEYQTNSLFIQAEVGATDKEWRIGRKAWLESFLKRDQIYYTPHGVLREKQAREILEKDLAVLSK